MSSKLVGIREAAEFLGVTPSTLRRWEREGKLLTDERTIGGYRRYDLARLRPETFHRADSGRRTVAYARVSSHEQKDVWNGKNASWSSIVSARAGHSRSWPTSGQE